MLSWVHVACCKTAFTLRRVADSPGNNYGTEAHRTAEIYQEGSWDETSTSRVSDQHGLFLWVG